MNKIVYWSGSGNTEQMAINIEKGLLESGKEVHMEQVSTAKVEDVLQADLIILGCPSMGSEELEEDEMQPFVESILPQIKDKKVALFGSYGWGSGEWMENWCEQMKAAGANVVCEPLIVNEFTKGQDENLCETYGKTLSQM